MLKARGPASSTAHRCIAASACPMKSHPGRGPAHAVVVALCRSFTSLKGGGTDLVMATGYSLCSALSVMLVGVHWAIVFMCRRCRSRHMIKYGHRNAHGISSGGTNEEAL